jgi:CDP-diacylglycerol--glycerol-3-phosphate 3-phosphatidyltransferase
MGKSPWPMVATYFRIFIVPVFIALMQIQPSWWAVAGGLLFIVASITDWLDGFLARRLNSVSVMGKFMDPIADKVLVSSVLICMIPLGMIEGLAVLILINRDVIIGGVRSVAASQGLVIDAGQVGKWKTTFQMISIPALFFAQSPFFQETPWSHIPMQEIGYYGLWLSVLLSLYSGVEYYLHWLRQAQNK